MLELELELRTEPELERRTERRTEQALEVAGSYGRSVVQGEPEAAMLEEFGKLNGERVG